MTSSVHPLVCWLEHACRAALPDLPRLATPATRTDVDRYLNCGRDENAAAAIAANNGKAFVYLVHEAVELQSVRACLDEPAPTTSVTPSVRRISPVVPDPWIRAIERHRERIAEADVVARAVEARVERFLARLLLGEDVGLPALVQTLSSVPSAADARGADQALRALDHLGTVRMSTPDPQHKPATPTTLAWASRQPSCHAR